MGLTLEKQRKLAHVAQRYYLEDWKQSDIAEELGVSRPLISRMLREARELKDLKALLYFTDGDGVYPSAPPDYETAFVLLQVTGHPELVPKWGRCLLV